MNSKRNIRLLYALNFCIDFIPYAPVAVLYFTQVSGSFTLGMSVFSVVMLSAGLFQIPTGLLSDRFGRKKTIVLGTFASVLSAMLYAIGHTYLFLVVGSVFAGLARACYSGNNDALLYETLAEAQNEDEYHHHLGKASTMFQIALVLSAALGGILANWSFALVMWVSVLPQLCALGISLYFTEPKNHTGQKQSFAILLEAMKQFRRNPTLRRMTLAYVVGYGVGESSYNFRAAFISSVWPVWALGIPSIIANIGGAFSFYFSGRVLNKIAPLKALSIQVASNRVFNVLAYGFPSVVSPVILSATSLTYGVGTVAENMLFQKEFTDKERATLGSLNSLGGDFVFALAAVLVGWVGDMIGPTKTLLFTQILLALPLFFYWKIYQHQKIRTGIT